MAEPDHADQVAARLDDERRMTVFPGDGQTCARLGLPRLAG
jgi:hypothetical protein